MVDDFTLLIIGIATVVDTVLLLALLERPNVRYVTLWLMLLVCGAWLWHAASFFHVQLAFATDPWAARINGLSMFAMAAGLMLLPSAMIHGVARLTVSGLERWPRFDWRFGVAYLPMLLLIPVAVTLSRRHDGEFLEVLDRFRIPYVALITIVNSAGAVTYLRLRRRTELPHANSMFLWMAISLFALSALVVFTVFFALEQWPNAETLIKTLVIVSPVGPTLLFGYYVIRFRFLPLVLERSLVYGAIVAGMMLFHRLAVGDLSDQLTERFRVDFGIIEGIVGFTLILAYRPLRLRVAEGLRYLLGRRLTGLRERSRRLSLELSRRSASTPQELTNWLATEVCETFGVDRVTVELANPQIPSRTVPDFWQPIDSETIRTIINALRESDRHVCTPADATDRASLSAMEDCRAGAAILIEHGPVNGVMIVGRRRLNQSLGDEELNTLVMLVEQLAIAIHNSHLNAERLAAERLALRNEKLSELGLLAGAIAHEVRNPLSSIKTIATVMVEDLGADHPHAEDLQLILSEIDRLSDSTTSLLDVARTGQTPPDGVSVNDVIDRILRTMRHVARKHDLTVTTDLHEADTHVAADSGTLREIYLNLLLNSVDAAGKGGAINVATRLSDGRLVTEVRDNGPGIAPEIQDRLFEPLATTKSNGTGLGLYIVGRRVRELGGEIRCRTSPTEGTSFMVSLPALKQKEPS